jgi:hypothetical protein
LVAASPRYELPGKKIKNFLQGVIVGHLAPKEPDTEQPSEDE